MHFDFDENITPTTLMQVRASRYKREEREREKEREKERREGEREDERCVWPDDRETDRLIRIMRLIAVIGVDS